MRMCARATRPGEVWAILRQISYKFPFLVVELISIIFHFVKHTHVCEREGWNALMDKMNRERNARLQAGAADPTPKWRLLAFDSIECYHLALREEKKRDREREVRKVTDSLPEFVLWGFKSEGAFKRARNSMKLASPGQK